MDAISLAMHEGSGAISKAKFLAKAVRFGRPLEAGVGLHKLLGLASEEELQAKLRQAGENGIVEEISALDSKLKDAAGYTDADWLNYLKELPAEERKMPAGMPDVVLDEGHQLMRLEDFVQHPVAVAAGLKRAHVLALRLYTTSVHHAINKPLLEGCSQNKPHPYPVTVALIFDALKKLRTAAEAAARDQAARAASQPAAAPPPPGSEAAVAAAQGTNVHTHTLWRGVAELHSLHELKQRGCTELGFVSCSTSRAVAEEYALRPADDGAPLSTVLKIRADLNNGSDLSWCAAFPVEAECVYPPCTYLEARTSWDEPVVLPSGEELSVKVVEVVPRVLGASMT